MMRTWREEHDEACGPCKDAEAYGKGLVVVSARALRVGDVVFFSPTGRIERTRLHPHHCTGRVVRLERVKRHDEAAIEWDDCAMCGPRSESTWGKGSGGVALILERS